MRHAPNRIFMLEEGKYIEIDYEYYQRLIKDEPMRRFWLFGGMLMEVPEEDYVQMNREKSRMQYQNKLARQVGEFSYDALGSDDFDGAAILENPGLDVSEIVEKHIMLSKLRELIKELSTEEQELIKALYFENVTEREYARNKGISHTTVQKRLKRVIGKLKVLMGCID